jgi:hypothetical protein
MANLRSYRDFRLFLANPAPAAERIEFSFITPRALPVLAAVTPEDHFIERLRLVDQTIEEFPFGIETDTRESLDYTIQYARDCGIALAQFIPMTPLPGTVDFHLMRRGKKALKLIKDDYDYWLDPHHPRILYQHPHLSEQELLDRVEKAWRVFYSVSAILKRCRHLGLLRDLRKFLAYLVVCRGLLTRYKRYGISADSAVRETKRRLATLLGRTALALMKRPATANGDGPIEISTRRSSG